jgi:hypothetical protein
MATNYDVEFKVGIDKKGKLQSDYKRTMAIIQNENKKLNTQLKKMGGTSKKTFESMTKSSLAFKAAIVAIGGYMTGKLAQSFIKAGSEMENLTTEFKVLLGSVDAAKERMEELEKFAQTTPFQLDEVAKASKILETFTKGALSTGDSLRMVGDAAAITSEKDFANLAMWVGRAYDALESNRPVGEAMMRLQELALVSGEARGKIEELQKAGKGKDAWKVLEGELLKAKGGMNELSQTVTGLTSTFKDQLQAAMRQMMESGVWDSLKAGLTSMVNLMNKAIQGGFFEKFGQSIASLLDAWKKLAGFVNAGQVDWDKDATKLEKVTEAIKVLENQQSNLIHKRIELHRLRENEEGFDEKEKKAKSEIVDINNKIAEAQSTVSRIAGESFIHEGTNLNALKRALVGKLELLKEEKALKETEVGAAPTQEGPGRKEIEAAQKVQEELSLLRLDGYQRELAELELFIEEKAAVLKLGGESVVELENYYDAEVAKIQERQMDRVWENIENQIEADNKLAETKKQNADREKAIAAAKKETERGYVSQAIGNFSKLLGANKQFSAAQKALQVAQAVRSTYFSAQKMFEAGTQFPYPANAVMPFILSASAVAAGIANVSQIIKARDGGVFDGPMSGYPAVLHGNEAVIPLKNGAVPVSLEGGAGGGTTIINHYYSTPSGYSSIGMTEPERMAEMENEQFQREAYGVAA